MKQAKRRTVNATEVLCVCACHALPLALKSISFYKLHTQRHSGSHSATDYSEEEKRRRCKTQLLQMQAASEFRSVRRPRTSTASNMVAQHQCCLLWSARRLHQSRSVAKWSWLKDGKITKVGKGIRPSSSPFEDLRDALKALEPKADSHADRLAQI